MYKCACKFLTKKYRNTYFRGVIVCNYVFIKKIRPVPCGGGPATFVFLSSRSKFAFLLLYELVVFRGRPANAMCLIERSAKEEHAGGFDSTIKHGSIQCI